MDLLRSLPIGLYLENPTTWLHRVDPRVKLAWLVSVLASPIAAHVYWRLSIAVALLVLTLVTAIPWRVWKRQMGLILLFSLLIFGITFVAPDGLEVRHQPRLPAQELLLPSQVAASAEPDSDAPEATSEPIDPTLAPTYPRATAYRYEFFEFWWFRATQRSLNLAIRVGTLTFTLLYSTNLYLLTTAPEEVTAAFEVLMAPLRRFNLPVTEIILTLTLSLRFIPLVLEETQNLVRSVRTRAINWKKLGIRGSTQVWLTLAERLLENLLLRAEQIASAMQVRGFLGADQHQVRWYQFRLKLLDWLILLALGAFWSTRIFLGGR